MAARVRPSPIPRGSKRASLALRDAPARQSSTRANTRAPRRSRRSPPPSRVARTRVRAASLPRVAATADNARRPTTSPDTGGARGAGQRGAASGPDSGSPLGRLALQRRRRTSPDVAGRRGRPQPPLTCESWPALLTRLASPGLSPGLSPAAGSADGVGQPRRCARRTVVARSDHDAVRLDSPCGSPPHNDAAPLGAPRRAAAAPLHRFTSGPRLRHHPPRPRARRDHLHTSAGPPRGVVPLRGTRPAPASCGPASAGATGPRTPCSRSTPRRPRRPSPR